MLQPPWSEIGQMQQEISSIKTELYRKADTHEIHTICNKLDNLEHSLWDISSLLNGIESRLQACENKQING